MGTPATLKDLLSSVESIGNIHFAKGDSILASESYNYRLVLSERVLLSASTPAAERDMVISYFKLASISENGKNYLLKALDHAKNYQRMQPCSDSNFMVNDLIQRIEQYG